MPEPRIASISRKTAETDITVELTVDGSGQADIETGIGFFDHMLTAFAKHGLFDLKVKAKGDTPDFEVTLGGNNVQGISIDISLD